MKHLIIIKHIQNLESFVPLFQNGKKVTKMNQKLNGITMRRKLLQKLTPYILLQVHGLR